MGTLRLNPAFQDMGSNANRHALRPPDLAKQHVRTTRSLLATIRRELQGACEHISESESHRQISRNTEGQRLAPTRRREKALIDRSQLRQSTGRKRMVRTIVFVALVAAFVLTAAGVAGYVLSLH